jgi:hypothetical protein
MMGHAMAGKGEREEQVPCFPEHCRNDPLASLQLVSGLVA